MPVNANRLVCCNRCMSSTYMHLCVQDMNGSTCNLWVVAENSSNAINADLQNERPSNRQSSVHQCDQSCSQNIWKYVICFRQSSLSVHNEVTTLTLHCFSQDIALVAITVRTVHEEVMLLQSHHGSVLCIRLGIAVRAPALLGC